MSLRIVSLIAMAVMGASPNLSAAEPRVTTLSVDAKDQQRITHWGFATQNRPDWGQAWTITSHPQSLDVLYVESGATLVRIGIDFETYDKPKKREALKQAVLAATSRGIDWYGVPWSPPTHLKTFDQPNGMVKGEPNRLKPGCEGDVADWLVELIGWLDQQGVPLPVALSPQNEPDFGPPGYPGCVYTGQQIRKTIVELRSRLDGAGYGDVKVIGDEGAKPADDWYPTDDPDSGTVNMLGLLPGGDFASDAAYRQSLDVIATHTYDLHNNLYKARPAFMQEFHDAVVRSGKEAWMTEWETRHEHTHNDWEVITETMAHFNRDLSGMGFHAWLAWQMWSGALMHPGSNDPGKCVHRIRPTDYLVFKGLPLGKNPTYVDVRISSDNKQVKMSIRRDKVDGPIIANLDVPQTTLKGMGFETIRVPVSDASGTHDIFVKFDCPEHWREVSLNWIQLEGQRRVEAEALDDQFRSERWTSFVAPCYESGTRRYLVHDDGTTVQKRPLFYLFKKIWNEAPAGKDTFVRHVRSSDDSFQGESKEANIASYRQDLLALKSGERMTVVVINRNTESRPVRLTGLVGNRAQWFGYLKADAQSVNQDLSQHESVKIAGGTTGEMTLPPESIHVFVCAGEK